MKTAYVIALAALLLPAVGCSQTTFEYKQPPPVTTEKPPILDTAPREDPSADLRVPDVHLKKRLVAAGFINVGWDDLPRYPHDDTIIKDSGGAERVNEILINALHETGKFDVLERRRLDDVLKELNMKEGGLLDPDTAAKVGAMLGAQNMLLTAIGSNDDINTRLDEPIVAYLRLVDLSTGRVASSVRNTGADIRSALAAAVDALACLSDYAPWTGRIAQDTELGNELVINAGKDLGVREGDVFGVYSIGDAITDPETGALLGYAEQPIGLIRVIRVREKMSFAQPVELTGDVKVGDIVRPGME